MIALPSNKADMFSLPFVPLSVVEFLEMSDLASCETAQLFSPNIVQLLWDVVGRRWLSSQLLLTRSFLEAKLHGKRLITELMRYRRTVLVSASWKPWIVETSFCSVKATTHVAPQSEDRFGELSGFPPKPFQASIPVAVGADRGKALVVGMAFTGSGPIDDNLCIGIVGVKRCLSCKTAFDSLPHFGCCLSCQTVFVSFAPFSGKCFIEHDEITVQTQALPHVRQNSPYTAGIVWCHVTEDGAIRFMRQLNGVPLEDSGFIPHEMLPKHVEAYFPNLKIWRSHQQVDIKVSVEHWGSAFPAYMPVSKTDVFEISTPWSILDIDSTWSILHG